MPGRRECPELDRWQALLDDSLPADEQEHCERHLRACPACQERLDRALECGDELRRLSREVGDPTLVPADPTLVQVLERLQEGPSSPGPAPVGPADLDFLRPADRPGVLGLLGAYEVQEVLGQGGMGVVLKAFDPALHRLVAIKVMAAAVAGSATARRRFTREAQAAAAVCHDHIVAVHDVSEADGLPYLVMQYIAGESLQERLDRTGPLEVVEVVRIGLQAASGLAAAHAQGLIHRDVKPANLLLEDGLARVKITDFGLARMADDVGLTRAGMVAGTPEYMAPEQARGEAVDPRADLFSLGSVLYACCTGRPPFRAETPLAVLRRVSDEEPAPIRSLNPEVPAWLEAFIARLLAKDPTERFGSAAEVAALLEGYLAHLRQPTTVPPPNLPPVTADRTGRSAPAAPLPRAGWSRALLWPAAAVLLALLGTGTALWLAGGAGTPGAGATEFHQDFRSLDPNSPFLRPVALGGQPDDKGVRITLPAGQGKLPHSGFMAGFALHGDFEATVSFEILTADRPDTGYGVGVSIYAPIDAKGNDAASLARRVMPDGKVLFMSDRLIPADGKVTHHVKTLPAMAAAGKLRLRRVGSVVHYLVADGPNAEFVEVDQEEFGTDDVRPLQVGGDAGGSQSALDARLLDLSIRAEDLPGLPAPELASPPAAGGKGWRSAAALLGLVLALSVAVPLVVLLYVRRRRRAGKVPAEAPPPVGQLKPEAAPSAVSFPCPGCGKSLKARPELAGRKVKCPQCGQGAHVPSLKAGPPAP